MADQSLSIPGRLDQIEVICQLVDQGAQDAGFDDLTSYSCQLAVGEACENIILHGYGEEDLGDIDVLVDSNPGQLTITLRDTAPPFNAAKELADQDLDHNDPPVGGLGLKIIHKVMDKIEYSRRGDQNQLTLLKIYTPETT
jgi:anti-sigma regulatory factor (Ser/Thr protein kinase)